MHFSSFPCVFLFPSCLYHLFNQQTVLFAYDKRTSSYYLRNFAPLRLNLTVLTKNSGDSSRVKEAQRFGDNFRLHHKGMIVSRLSWALMPFRL